MILAGDANELCKIRITGTTYPIRKTIELATGSDEQKELALKTYADNRTAEKNYHTYFHKHEDGHYTIWCGSIGKEPYVPYWWRGPTREEEEQRIKDHDENPNWPDRVTTDAL